MKLIVDAGSTKTKYIRINDNNQIESSITKGINPFFQNAKDIESTIMESQLITEGSSIDEVHYYGAGCTNSEKTSLLQGIFKSLTGADIISVESDLLASARSLYKTRKGIAAILGTGANSGYYNGEAITEHTPALGYILGDEGSGASIGKRLVRDVFKKQLPFDLCEKFKERFSLDESTLLEKVYRKEQPNSFLASLSTFISENMNEEALLDLLKDEFDLFFIKNIKPYKTSHRSTIGFVGSIAYHYQEILKMSAKDFGIEIIDIQKDPEVGLIEYHKYNI